MRWQIRPAANKSVLHPHKEPWRLLTSVADTTECHLTGIEPVTH